MAHSVFHDEIEESEALKTKEQRFEEKVEPAEFGYIDVVSRTILGDLVAWGDANGQSRDIMGQLFSQAQGPMWDAIKGGLWADSFARDSETNRMLELNDAGDRLVQVRDPNYFQNTQGGLNDMIAWARNWMGAQIGSQLSPARSGSGSRGPRKATAEEIRQRFDIEELTADVNLMNQALVLEEHKNPKSVARAYVDAVVASGGEQKIDWQTFVRGGIEKSSRFKSIYANKPEDVSAEQYMAPYIQAASGYARPGEAADIAIGGAKFGSDASTFQSRLQRTDANTSSAGFINDLESRLGELNSVLKG